MPIKPPPLHLTCPQCHWHKRMDLPSDALSLPVIPERCERCGAQDLKFEAKAPQTGGLWQRLKHILLVDPL